MLGIPREEWRGAGQGMSCNPKIRVTARKPIFCQYHPKVAVGVYHGLIKRHQEKAATDPKIAPTA